MLRRRARCMCPILEIGLFEVGIPPPPRSIGIIGLGENSEIIYVAQSVTGKIFWNKELAPFPSAWPRLIIPFFGCGRQGRGSRIDVIWLRASGFRLPASGLRLPASNSLRKRAVENRPADVSFAPAGLGGQTAGYPRLAPWAVFFRRFAAATAWAIGHSEVPSETHVQTGIPKQPVGAARFRAPIVLFLEHREQQKANGQELKAHDDRNSVAPRAVN